MSLEEDPVRWSESGSDVPDVLRDLMEAGTSELPSASKMAALGAKVSAGAAGAGAGATSALGAAKLWVAGLGLGVAVLGGTALYLQGRETSPAPQVAPAAQATPSQGRAPAADEALPSESDVATREEAIAPPAATDVPAEPGGTGHLAAPTDTTPFVEATADSGPRQGAPQMAGDPTPEAAEPSVEVGHGERSKPAAASRVHRARSSGSGARPQRRPVNAQPSPARGTDDDAVRAAGADRGAANPTRDEASQPSELSLLMEARRALAQSPRRALSLAHQHAELYPQSQFAQERDALEIEALTRSGQLERARDAARSFVRRFPDSAHAHRFRERLDL